MSFRLLHVAWGLLLQGPNDRHTTYFFLKEEDRGLVHSRPTPVRVHKSAFTVKQKEERLKTCHENKHPVVESDGVTDAQRCKA